MIGRTYGCHGAHAVRRRHRRPGFLWSLALVWAGWSGCTSQPAPPRTSPSSSLSAPISQRVNRYVLSLGYSQEVAGRFLEWVGTWKDGHGLFLLDGWADELARARAGRTAAKTSPEDLARTEQRVAGRVLEQIRSQLQYNIEVFDLPDIIETRQAQCLGYVQVYWIVARAVDLAVIPVDVLQTDRDHRLPEDQGHICCAITLADHSTLIVDAVPNGQVHGPLVLGDLYVEQAGTLRLTGHAGSSDLYRSIHLLEPSGLAALLQSARAGRWVAAGQFQRAADLYTQAIDLSPDLSQVWGNRAVAFYRLGQMDRAIADCNQAMALDSGRPGPYNTRASVYMHIGRFQQALEDLNRAIGLDGRSAAAFYNRGHVYSRLRQFDRAVGDYGRAIELRPSWAGAHFNRGNAYHRLGRYREAIASFTRAIQLDPSLKQAYVNRGLSYAMLGDPSSAKKDLLTAVRADPALAGHVAQMSERFNLDKGDPQAHTRVP